MPKTEIDNIIESIVDFDIDDIVVGLDESDKSPDEDLIETYKSKSVKELKEILEKMELKQTGNKTTLIQRIIENLNK